MAASPNVGGQLVDMMNNLKRYERTTASAGPQTADLSFMTLLWPLLPLLPPEPPTVLIELLRESEKCDVCGTSQGTPMKTYTRTPQGTSEPVDKSGSSPLRHRRASDWRTPVDRLMMDIENKMNETLNSIQETTEKNTELSRKANEIEKQQMNKMSDADLLKTLKKLTKVKEDRMEKVKILEVKEQQLKESLTNAIEWARSIELNKDIPNSAKVAVENNSPDKDTPLDDKVQEQT